MSLAPRSWLVERCLKEAVFQFWPTGVTVPEFLGSEGDNLTTLPALRISFMGATEEPENSGNHLCEVLIELFGRIDPDNTSSTSWGAFEDRVRDHIATAGYVEEWLTDSLTESELETTDPNTSSAFTNQLKVHNIRLASFETDIDTVEGSLHHSWTLEIYLLQPPD